MLIIMDNNITSVYIFHNFLYMTAFRKDFSLDARDIGQLVYDVPTCMVRSGWALLLARGFLRFSCNELILR